MKTNSFFITLATLLYAGIMVALPPKAQMEEPENPFRNQKMVTSSDENEYPCACSKYQCACGGQLELKYKAWKEDRGECKWCNGTGRIGNSYIGYTDCSLCEGTGRDFEWHSGCVCENCGNVYEQPDDC